MRRFTNTEKRKIARWNKDGVTAVDIAKMLGRSTAAIYNYNHAQRKANAPKTTKPKVTAAAVTTVTAPREATTTDTAVRILRCNLTDTDKLRLVTLLLDTTAN